VSRRYERRARLVRQNGGAVEVARFSPGGTAGLVVGGAAIAAVAVPVGALIASGSVGRNR
jgi:hypothetical protein